MDRVASYDFTRYIYGNILYTLYATTEDGKGSNARMNPDEAIKQSFAGGFFFFCVAKVSKFEAEETRTKQARNTNSRRVYILLLQSQKAYKLLLG